MRLVRPRAALVLGPLLLVLLAPPARAEDRLSVRTAYFREASTRVVQPMLEVTKDLPQGYEVGAQVMVDAISSASIGQGATSDSVFTEKRYEGSLSAGRTMDLLKVQLFGRMSDEPDYKSASVGLSLSRELWERTGVLTVSAAYTHDSIEPPRIIHAPDTLDVAFAGVSYTQVLSPTVVAQASYEFFHNTGLMTNPYLAHANLGEDKAPRKRLRHALALRAGKFIPEADLGLQLAYRFYFDQESFTSIGAWGMTAHTLEARVYKTLLRDLEVRLAYRFHAQTAANFWCNSRPDSGGDIGCYPMGAEYHTVDVKFGNYTTHLPEGKLIWELRALTGMPVLGFLAPGALDLSYSYYFENTAYGMLFTDRNAPPLIGNVPLTRSHGGAHYIQTGYSLPF